MLSHDSLYYMVDICDWVYDTKKLLIRKLAQKYHLLPKFMVVD